MVKAGRAGAKEGADEVVKTVVSAAAKEMNVVRYAQSANLNRLARTQIRVLTRPLPAFQVCGCAGLTLAIVLTMGLVRYLGLSPVVMVSIVAISVPTFLGLVMATKIITGEERIVYYHHEIAVMLAAAALLWLTSEPLLPFLDITILGIGAFLACGRIGCLMVGCCHGRPHHWGIRYRPEHAAAGFTDYYVGVTLFPIQLVESIWVAGVVIIGVLLILNGEPAGSALAWYVVAYDFGRFFFEFTRGDPDRPYMWGFSQPQWLSVVLMALVVVAEKASRLPLTDWHLVAAALLVAAMLAIATKRRLQHIPKHHLLHPRHVREIAGLIGALADRLPEASEPFSWTVFPERYSRLEAIGIGDTSMGVRVSAGKIVEPSAKTVHHYTLSYRGADMSEETAQLLAAVIGQLGHYGVCSRLIKGGQGVVHALFVAES